MRPHRCAVVMGELLAWAIPADAAVRSLGNYTGSPAMRAPHAALAVIEYVEQLECDLTIERLRIQRLSKKLEQYERKAG